MINMTLCWDGFFSSEPKRTEPKTSLLPDKGSENRTPANGGTDLLPKMNQKWLLPQCHIMQGCLLKQ